MNYAKAILLHIITPLVIGGGTFLLLRSNSWIHAQLFSPGANLPFFKTSGVLADLLKYNLPDFCWSYALASSLFIWKRWWGISIPFFAAGVLLILAGAELIQLIPGGDFRFDIIDLLAAVLAFGLSCYLLYRHEKN